MSLLHTNARIVILAGAALLLGSWSLTGVLAKPVAEGSASSPAPAPELIGSRTDETTASPGVHPADGQGTAAAAVGRVVEEGVPTTTGAPVGIPDRADPAFARLLDQVFAPERTGSPSGRQPAGRLVGRGMPIDVARAGGRQDDMAAPAGQAQARPAGDRLDAGPADDANRPRPRNEKGYYQGFIDLAANDPAELAKQADAVLRSGGGENCEQVAMLRALYDTDHAAALAWFAQAITALPDRERPQGVSVPDFAVGFLCRQLADPAAKAMVERMAWSGYLALPGDQQRRAGEALIAAATPADLQRYASYPAYRDLTTVAGSDR